MPGTIVPGTLGFGCRYFSFTFSPTLSPTSSLLGTVLCLLLLFTAYPSPLTSQTLKSSLGRDFWVAFPPTEHSGEGYLALFVSADEETSVTITARSRAGVETTQQLTVPAGSVREVMFNRDDYELHSAEYPNTTDNRGDCERPLSTSIHVTANQDVAVYAVARDEKTSDAWLVFPTPVLGLDHRILSYGSDYGVVRIGFIIVQTKYYPSQFVVVATENDTKVDITLSVSRTNQGIGRDRSVVLQRGQSYLMQAHVSESSRNEDFTGTRIRATKPVVVLGSHFRAQVPLISNDASRDILVEQMPSVDLWGRTFAVPPLQPPQDFFKDGSQDVTVVRIITHVDSTFITVDSMAPLLQPRAGSVWELPLSRGRTIQASHPVMVGILDRSARRQASIEYTGDPSLIIVPPVEQYLSGYRTVNIQPRNSVSNNVYTEHHLTVFAPLDASGIHVDGTPIPALTPIGSSQYGYAHIPVQGGVHTTMATLNQGSDTAAAFGILVYGYGPAESYGYTGGMAFEKLYQPEVIFRVLDCKGAPGDSVQLVVVVDSMTEVASFDALSARRIKGTVTVDATVFVPSPTHYPDWTALEPHRSTVAFRYTFDSLRVGDTVAVIKGRCVLGSVTADTLKLGTVEFLDVADVVLPIKPTTKNGLLTVLEICDANGLRLFDPHAVATTSARYFDVLGNELQYPVRGQLMYVLPSTSSPATKYVWLR